MPRITQWEALGVPWPQLGQIVFFHPKHGENTARNLPAIIHHITDGARGIVDLTVFFDRGPQVKKDVEQAPGDVEERWSHQQG